MQSIDQGAVRDHGLTIDGLMETAGRLITQNILQIPVVKKTDPIAIFCGPGNNGGDGLVVARLLAQAGFNQVLVGLVTSQTKSLQIALNLKRLQKTSVQVLSLTEANLKNLDFKKYKVFIDAIFGTGLTRHVDGVAADIVDKINESHRFVVALDIPSGMDADTGRSLGVCVRASLTLTCGLAKPGFYLGKGPENLGRLKILDLGFPEDLVRATAKSTFVFSRNGARSLLPRRNRQSNKSTFGHVLVLAGSEGMAGAAILCATAAARMGAGYVTVASPSEKVLKKMPPDFLQISWKKVKDLKWEGFDAVIVGPGLGVNPYTADLVQTLAARKVKNVVLDADALTIIAQGKVKLLPPTWVLTPHAGELSRLINIPAKKIEDDRLFSVKAAQQMWGAQILLKGYHTVLRSGIKAYIINSGNVALAKAGTGDVLSGFIGSLMAQGLSGRKAAVLGSYVHGRIADLWLERGGSERTLIASDLPKLLHGVLREIE